MSEGMSGDFYDRKTSLDLHADERRDRLAAAYVRRTCADAELILAALDLA